MFGPFMIPVVALFIPIVAIIGGIWAQAQKNRLIAEQRMAMLARGLPLAEIEAALKSSINLFKESEDTPKDPLRPLRNARRAATVLISVGIGMVLFGILLEGILRVREVFAVSAAGLIPLFIGFGFVIDYFLQKRELARFGLDAVGADPR